MRFPLHLHSTPFSRPVWDARGGPSITADPIEGHRRARSDGSMARQYHVPWPPGGPNEE